MNEVLTVLDRKDFEQNPERFKAIVQASYNEEAKYRELKNQTKEYVRRMTIFKESLNSLIEII